MRTEFDYVIALRPDQITAVKEWRANGNFVGEVMLLEEAAVFEVHCADSEDAVTVKLAFYNLP